MKINVDRMATLAGLGKASRSNRLNESMQYEEEIDGNGGMDEFTGGIGMDEMDEMDYMEEDEASMDEIIEVDERELVQELRRAKKMMLEAKKRNQKQSLQETNLKKIIEEEVKNIFGELDLNLNADWIYGKNKPKVSKKGYTAQGSFLKGVGFK